jgi:two-component system OmpR family response regulator
MRILLVEDDIALRETLTSVLTRSGHGVDALADGRSADTALYAGGYDLAVLDIGLPLLDGFEVLRRLRDRRDKTPVLVLTARDEVENRVKGLDLGADDYLTKPFALIEFEARVRAALRRGSGASSTLEVGSIRLDIETKQLFIGDEPLLLSLREVAILEALMISAGKVVRKQKLTQQLSRWDSEIGTNAVEVYVHRLRKKLEPRGVIIRTIYGLGYLLETTHEV